jgi:hypothetical protein
VDVVLGSHVRSSHIGKADALQVINYLKKMPLAVLWKRGIVDPYGGVHLRGRRVNAAFLFKGPGSGSGPMHTPSARSFAGT